uniref:Uncharacterized protein n=1 Tax=Setaria italica TaxID=4555 RepID=K3ZBN0_SETIT
MLSNWAAQAGPNACVILGYIHASCMTNSCLRVIVIHSHHHARALPPRLFVCRRLLSSEGSS